MELSICASGKLNVTIYDVNIINIDGVYLKYSADIAKFLYKYGFFMYQIDNNVDCQKLYTHYMLSIIFDIIKTNPNHKHGFFMGKDSEKSNEMLLKILKKYLKYDIFTFNDTFFVFMSILAEPADKNHDNLVSDILTFTEKIKKTHRIDKINIPQLKKQLKKEGLDLISSQYFNDYNTKYLLLK